MPTDEIKLYCVVSREAVEACKGVRGKMATQCGHAYVHAFWDAMDRFPVRAAEYRMSPHVPKITLIASEAEVKELFYRYRPICGASLVTDAARTVFSRPTITAVGIGPIKESEREELLSSLRPWT